MTFLDKWWTRIRWPIELDFVRSHVHNLDGSYQPIGGGGSAGVLEQVAPQNSLYFGKEQNTVLNAYVNYIIKY